MNTKTKLVQKNQTHKARQKQEPKRQRREPTSLPGEQKFHEQERPETRMFR